MALTYSRNIPSEYLKEFTAQHTALVKNRVKLLCALSLVFYFLAAGISYISYPKDFNPAEIPLWGILIGGTALILYMNRGTRTKTATKVSAYIFTALLLYFITRIGVIYFRYFELMATIYLFLLFLVSFTIPWTPLEIIPITFMHLLMYTSLFLYIVIYTPERAGPEINYEACYDGIITILMGAILCFIVRAKEAARDIKNFVLMKEVEKRNAQMETELRLATRIHKTLIPKSIKTDAADIAVTYLPMYYMGGDYAKFHFVDKDKLIFIISDITGHGVSAALLVNRLHAEFERLSREMKSPGELLRELNDFIVDDFSGINMYLSAFCGLIDFGKKRLTYSNHGHPPQYIYRIAGANIEQLESQGSLLGLPDKDENIYQHEIGFNGGDKLLLFTDGITETRNAAREEYGEQRVKDFIMKNSAFEAPIFNKKLIEELAAFKDGEFRDDIFILNIWMR